MIEAAETACNFVADRLQGDLEVDRMLYLAVVRATVRATEIIGEAASKVGSETRRASPGIPWQTIVAMRNRIVHAYFDLNHLTVWRTVTEEIPQLLPKLHSLLEAG